MGKKVKIATSLKDNFWSRKRVEAGLHVKELAGMLNMPYSTVGEYLSGQLIPPDNVIKALCELFDVNYDTGALEFQRANRAWKSMREHKDYKVINTNTLRAEALVPEVDKKEPVIDYRTKFLKAVYGCVSYEQYEELKHYVEVEGADTLRYLYGKIDYDLYQRISSLLSEESAEPMF